MRIKLPSKFPRPRHSTACALPDLPRMVPNARVMSCIRRDQESFIVARELIIVSTTSSTFEQNLRLRNKLRISEFSNEPLAGRESRYISPNESYVFKRVRIIHDARAVLLQAKFRLRREPSVLRSIKIQRFNVKFK